MRRVHACLRRLALGVFAANAGCQKAEAKSYPAIEATELAESYAELICGLAFECGCRDTGYADVDACVVAFREHFQTGIDAGVDAGLAYDAQCAGQIVGQVAELGCGEEPSEGSSCTDCKPFFGEVGRGEICSTDAEGNDDCQQGLACRFDGGGQRCSDLCVQSDLLNEGQPCWDPMSSMSLGECDYREELFCDASGDGNCTKAAALGENCGDAPCQDGLVCEVLDPDTRRCAVAPGWGEACPMFECALGLTCDFTDPTDPRCVDSEAFVCFFTVPP